jgi:protein-tyrosine phosphatase
MAALRNVTNFRDIGGAQTACGGRVRTGVVYRSGHLADVDADDLARLEALGIRTVIDFRTRTDVASDGGSPLPGGGSPLPRGARHVPLPIGDPARAPVDLRELVMGEDRQAMQRHLGTDRAVQMMLAAAEALVVEQRAQYGAMLRHLAQPHALPAIVHCSAGKDRTGWAASLLLLIAGVGDDAIVAHYAESDVHRANANARALARLPQGIDPEWLRPFFECRPEYARASLAALRARWGDVDRYALEGLGISSAELGALRSSLVEA